MRSTLTRIGTAALCLICFPLAAVSAPTIAIDGLHGLPDGGDYQLDLEQLYPEVDFVYLDQHRMPIHHILGEGNLPGDYETDSAVVALPPGIEALYVRVDVDYIPSQIDQLPYIWIVAADETVTKGSYGMCHLDDPDAGIYVVRFGFGPNPDHYVIGTGPHLWDVYPPEDYDAVMTMWGHTWVFFRGWPTPHSPSDYQRLQQCLDSGGGYLLAYDGLGPIAEKPVIQLANWSDASRRIQIDVPGRATYTRPVPEGKRPLIWDVKDSRSDRELLYEAVLDRPLDFVRLDDGLLVNDSWAVVHDARLLELVPEQGYRISECGTLLPEESRAWCPGPTLTYDEAEHRLDAILRDEALSTGMTRDEVQGFFHKYGWSHRLLIDVATSEGPVVLYRIEGEDYDALLPLHCDPMPEEQVRVLWVCAVAGQTENGPGYAHPRAGTPDRSALDEPCGTLHEYGFLRETRGGNSLDELEAWGWTCYDLILMDSSDYDEWWGNPLFDTWGQSPLVAELSEGVETVRGYDATGIVPENGDADVVLRGDEDTWSDYPGSPFTPGSYPPVVVAREEQGGGRIAGISDLHFMEDRYNNVQLTQNLFEWLDESATGSGPDFDIAVAVVETTLIGETSATTSTVVMNRGDEPLTITSTPPSVAWLETEGPAETTIPPTSSVTYTLTWSSSGMPSGYFMTEWGFTTNDANESQLFWPVRMRVISGVPLDPESPPELPSELRLTGAYPNPFNGQTTLRFAIPSEGEVHFTLYDVTGRTVIDLPTRHWSAGNNRLEIALDNQPTGIYFLRADFRNSSDIRKLMLLK